MNKIKRLSLVIALILVANIKVFAEGGFEFAVNVPIGASFGITSGFEPKYTSSSGTTKSAITTEAGFDSGVQVQIGYMFTFGNFGLSLLGDLGYSYDSYRYSDYLDYEYNSVKEKHKETISMYMHNFQVGILPKFNFGNFAWGIGGGVKIPMTGTLEDKVENSLYGNSTTKIDYKSSYFEVPVIGYFKMTFDYSFFFNDSMAFVLGAYLGADIGPIWKQGEITLAKDASISSFDIGVNLGFKFGPRLN
ncbi:hypothetical protein Bint_2852 [Brachyspira intermedia PWS/A]|uniref:Serpentine_recp domain containing protein n=1 Tax=Brachyspira intermedia (strain ATCC 51140 / PWS/A) TaxID=1045858 RepID=G0EI91_BRAIP|nr:hypothetical protein [Brachyspira intermedia]AEM23446.1 hypothetical protein Bint_2852 [Brachyspira intermedia PWS/A]